MSERNAYTPTELVLLHDEAHRRAHRLRDEAMSAFWQGLGDVLAGQQLRARRAAGRYAHRLARHLRGRATPVAPVRSCPDAAP